MGVGAGEVDMIRLPTFQERAKIATPNKAGTLLGVSPFSSVRNVMAKVQDTSSFIEAARAIHGDRYDYSQTDYVGSGKPITIICKKHGAFVLAEAQSHYGKKQCGCKPCTTEKRKSGEVGVPLKIIACECGFSGSRHEFNLRSELCHACHAKQREEKYTVKCRGCGTRFPTSLKKPYCSNECRLRHKPIQHRKFQGECCVCGKQVVRRVYKNRKRVCCSLECQRKLALSINKGGPETDWLVRSKKARGKWISASRKVRSCASGENKWQNAIRKGLARIKSIAKKNVVNDRWHHALLNRFSSHRGRDVVRKQHLKPSGSISRALTRVDCERAWFSKDEWNKKLGNKLSSLSSRRRRKRNAKRVKNSVSEEKTGSVTVQMCFDWLADYA